MVFDFDGVLIDTEPLYLRTVNAVLAEAGAAALTEEANAAFIGKPAGYTWASLQTQYGLPREAAFYQQRYDELLVGVLERELRLRPEAETLLKEVEARGLPRAVATSSRRKWADIKLRLLGMEDYFDAVVSAEDVGGRSKPLPDVYLRAAELAGIDTARGMAIEDSPSGIVSAKAAGLFTVALRTTSTVGVDVSQADMVIDSLDDFDVDLLAAAGASQQSTRLQVR
jgi:HAD superfamily hydrolase (TIGR01509 family)